MRRLFTLLLCLISVSIKAQWAPTGYEYITFDPGDSYYRSLISIDTVHYHHNIWQIGRPAKTVFAAAYSAPNAIVTDTLNPYPVNDTSVFIAKIPGMRLGVWPLQRFEFYYQLHIDSGATARIEVSEDTGVHWKNVIDSLPSTYLGWGSDTPDLHQSTTGWAHFFLSRNWVAVPDTILFRFTFISDSVFNSKDGWIIDNFSVSYWWEGAVHEVQNPNLITVYPNPSRGNIYIHPSKRALGQVSIVIYDIAGKEVYKADKLQNAGYLNLTLPDGIYTLKYVADDEYCTKRFVVTGK